MSEASTAANLQARGAVYRLLSACFFEPEAETRDLLANLRDWMKKAFPQYLGRAETLLAKFGSTAEEVLARKVEHTSLFSGPSQELAPPYGSIYLEEHPRLMGESTAQVMERYRQAGLRVDFPEAPDHLAIELEFLHFLALEALTKPEAAAAMEAFARDLLLPWVGKFARKVVEIGRSEFYGELASLTANFVQNDFS